METKELIAEHQARLVRTRRQMEQEQVDLLLVYSRGKREMLRMDAVRYLTRYSGLGKDAILIVEPSDTPLLLVNPPEISEIVQDEVINARMLGTSDLPASLEKILGKPGRADHKILFVGQDFIPVEPFRRIQQLFSPGFFVDDDFMRRVGRVKSPWEIQRIRRAQQMADNGFRNLLEKVKPGIREFELAAELEFSLRMQGAMDNFGLMASCKHNQAIRPPTERKLENGDIVIAEITPECEGYFAQLCRTIVLGEPSRLVLEKYDLLKRCFEAGLKAAKPGAMAEGVALAINAITTQAGYETFSKPPYMRSRGHGLGQGSNFPGEFKEGNKVVLEEGMTFIIHPNQYIPETGYLMLGESCQVLSQGSESLSTLEQQVFSVNSK